jgi:hypothetical protein
MLIPFLLLKDLLMKRSGFQYENLLQVVIYVSPFVKGLEFPSAKIKRTENTTKIETPRKNPQNQLTDMSHSLKCVMKLSYTIIPNCM